ncbi:MAG TPA: glucose 1-dehydrogenase [Hyphomicrobiaceae bacterium]|nr:glucose 1-dehydrogenase [Hyphomicrobiaceae bacterium]
MGRLEGKCALVTGGGRGIGAATALGLAREGARVAIMGKGEASLNTMQSEAAAQRLAIETFVGDVGRKEDAVRVVDAVVAQFGRIDVLVNNAGMAVNRPFADKSVEDVNEVLRVNFVGTFLMSQAAARHMRGAGSGTIVNVASVRGVEHCGREGVMDYSAAKAAVISLTKTMAKELAPNINVNVVSPGHTNTDLLRGMPEEVKSTMLAGTYLRRFAEPEDIAHAIVFFASAEANFITGQHLVVDGGFSLK